LRTLLLLIGHAGLDGIFGWSLLNSRRHERTWLETAVLSVLLGMYVETLAVAVLIFVGMNLDTAGIATALALGVVTAALLRRSWRNSPALHVKALHWYEWALLAMAGEKIAFAVWQLFRFHTYFVDALMHWSGRARALYGEVNWSLDPASPFFLGKYIGSGNYPLQTILWRALSAKLNGEWNEIISRADGVIFFVVIVAIVWAAVYRFSNSRAAAAAAAFVVSAVPLEAWHAAGGYSDIAVEAFLVAAVSALIRKDWFVSGIMIAGAVWAKNDGLVIYFPALLLAVVAMQIQGQRKTQWRPVGSFTLGFITIAPWLIFNYLHSLGVTPVTATPPSVQWHSGVSRLLVNALFTSPTSSVLWTVMLPCLVYLAFSMFKEPTGRALLLAFSGMLLSILFLFTATNAYVFLVNESTIHRVLMQFSATAILIATYGLWLKHRSAEQPVRTRTR
jgi:hypothetical protein